MQNSPTSLPVRALNSSSNLHRRKLCPGSARAEWQAMRAVMPPDADTPAAEEGTLLHWHDANPGASRDQLTPPQIRLLEKNARLRQQFLELQLPRLGISPDAPCREFVEQEFFLCNESGVPWVNPLTGEHFPGHPDRILFYPVVTHPDLGRINVAIIFDSKFGFEPVTKADANLQLRSYAVMFAEHFDCALVLAAITQPRLAAPDDFHAVEYSAADIVAGKQEILDLLITTLSPDAQRVPSFEACTYCKAKANCREAVAVVAELAAMKVNSLGIGDLENLADDMWLSQKVYAAWETRLKFIAEKKPELLKRFGLSAESANREITNWLSAFDALHEAGLLHGDRPQAFAEFLGCCKPSLPQLEEMISKQRGLTLDVATQRTAQALGSLVAHKPKARSLVEKTQPES